MIKQAYINGFMHKCAEYGIDGRRVLEKVAGPRPEERKAIQRITSNPKTLKALTTPDAAPPRVDDPVWNPANVQKWVTAGATSPVWYGPTTAAALALPSAIGGEAGIATAVAELLGGAFKTVDMNKRREESAEQRKIDANAILNDKPLQKPIFTKR